MGRAHTPFAGKIKKKLMTEVTSNHSRRQVLKSTSIIGGATVVSLAIRIVRTKILAILLGPSGIGLDGVYNSIIDLARTISSLGINISGVRQIAAAVGEGDRRVIGHTVVTLRRVSIIAGTIGALLLFCIRGPLSRLTFGNAEHATGIGLLSIALFFGVVGASQGALLQGVRRIGDLAKMGVIGAIIATVVSIPIVWIWGQKGIPFYLVLIAAMTTLVSWLYARRVQVERLAISMGQVVREASALLKLGIILLFSALMPFGAMYFLRVLVTRMEGVDGVGQFQAANNLSTIYVSFILQAMSADFYPRLTGVATDRAKCNQVANEQVEISMLLALPGILATLVLAPLIIHFFYSSKFGMAAQILRWQIIGVLFQVACWPLGMIPVATGRARLSLFAETLGSASYVLLAWFGLQYFGLPGTGMAFVGAYLFYWVLIYLVVKQVTGFGWSARNIQLILGGSIMVVLALVAHLLLPGVWSAAIGGILTLAAAAYCLKHLWEIIGTERICHYLRKMGLGFLTPSSSDHSE